MATQSITINYPEPEFKILLSDCFSESVKKEIAAFLALQEPRKQILTRQETAKMLDISLPTLHNYTRSGYIKAFRLGYKVRYRLQDIQDSLLQIKVR